MQAGYSNRNTLAGEEAKFPSWITQDIDKENSCDIIPCDGIKIIKFPGASTYTATYTEGSFVWKKVDKGKTGLDFDWRLSNPKYYSDTCQLKEELRSFIKLKMTEYISNNLK